MRRRGNVHAWLLLLLAVIGLPQQTLAQPYAGQKVVGVELHVPAGMPTAGIVDLIAVLQGQPYSARLVRRSIERLYATKRFSDVVVRAEETPRGLRVIFEIVLKRNIVGVTIDGNQVVKDAAILEATRLRADEEFYPERLAEAIRAAKVLYERHGYYEAKVTETLQELAGGVDVLLEVAEGPPTRIRTITVAGEPGLPLSQLLRTAEVGVGDVLNLNTLTQGVDKIKALLRTEGFYQASVFEPQIRRDGLLADVALPLTAGPRLKIVFEGNRNFPDQVLRRVIGYDGSETLNRAVATRMAKRIEAFYRYRGYSDVRVRFREIISPSTRDAVVRFEIDEGPVLRVRNVTFAGTKQLSESLLRTVLEERMMVQAPEGGREIRRTDDPVDLEGRTLSLERAPPPEVPTSSTFIKDAYRDAAKSMEEVYRERGFLSARVAFVLADVDVSERLVDARFEIQEGPQTIVQRVVMVGVPAGINATKDTKLLPGMPLGMSKVDEGREALLQTLRTRGYLFAHVIARPDFSSDQTTAVLTYEVIPGPQVRVGRIILQGLVRTKENVVLANLALKENAVLNPELLFESQRNLVLLGIFRHVAVKLISPETKEPTKDVVVELKERPRLSGENSGGYSPVDGPRTFFDLSYPNFAGLGINMSVRAKLNYAGASAQVLNGTVDPGELQGINGLGGRLNLSMHWPRIYSLLPARIGARVDLIAERVRRSSFQFTRYASILGLDWTAKDWLGFSLQYEIEHDQVSGVRGVELLALNSGVDIQRLRFPEGAFNLHSLRFGPSLDFRDDPINPHKGLLIGATAELTQDLGATLFEAGGSYPTHIYTLKLFGSVTVYLPMTSRVVLALSTRGGTILPLIENSRTIPPKRFFLGGAASMRGFREDAVLPQDRRGELRQEYRDCSALANRAGCTPAGADLVAGKEVPSEGGEAFALGKAELRLPFFGPVDLGLFMEAGNLWLDRTQVNLLDLRTVAGFGIRVGTPIGPLAFDTGFNLFPDVDLNEQTVNFHFTIGLF